MKDKKKMHGPTNTEYYPHPSWFLEFPMLSELATLPSQHLPLFQPSVDLLQTQEASAHTCHLAPGPGPELFYVHRFHYLRLYFDNAPLGDILSCK